MPGFLTRSDLIEYTGYKQPRRQIAALAQAGIPYRVRQRDGRPVVAWDDILSTRDDTERQVIEAIRRGT